jgi:hypothetical protein
MPARSSNADRSTPVHSALPAAPSSHSNSARLRDEGHAAVTCALQHEHPPFEWHFAQLTIRQSQRVPDGAVDTEVVGAEVDTWRREMTAHIEQLGRSQIRLDLIERRLEIARLLLSTDQGAAGPITRRGAQSYRATSCRVVGAVAGPIPAPVR